MRVGRTGYTGEPLCFELFVAAEAAPRCGTPWSQAGLRRPAWAPATRYASKPDCRSTASSSAGTTKGAEIPIFAIPLVKLAVSFSPLKGEYIGRAALARQHDAFAGIVSRDYTLRATLPRSSSRSP